MQFRSVVKSLSATFLTSLIVNSAQAGYVDSPKHDRISEIPKLMAEGQNGYCIMLSAELKGQLKNLDAFIKHKEARGFKVHIVYSNEWGGGTGLQSVRNSTNWLKKNYKEKNLLYVLLVGNPHPDEGDLAHAASALAWTDWPYMDLDSDWGPALYRKVKKSKDGESTTPTYPDANAPTEGRLTGKKSKGIENINGVWEVLVGRIPYYGEESKHWKAADVDVILARTMRYENEQGDTSWRLNWAFAEHGDGSKKTRTRELMDKFGANYIRLWQQWGDTAPPDGEPNEIKETLNHHQEAKKDPIGFVHYHSHGSGDSVAATISSKKAVELKDDYPAVHYVNACSVGTPRNDNNVVGALFRYNGIAAIGPSMSVISPNGAKIKIPGSLYTGQSIGESFWNLQKSRAFGEQGIWGLNKTTLCYYLQGDPSVVPIKQATGSYLQVSPYAAQYDKVVGDKASIFRKYTVYNNTDKEMKVTVKSSQAWLQISKPSLTLPPGKGTFLVAKVNVKHPSVILGVNDATISMTSASMKREVKYRLEKELERQVYYNPLNLPVRGKQRNEQDKEGLLFSPMTSGRLDKAVKLDFDLELNDETRGLMVPGMNSFTLSFWFKGVTKTKEEVEVDTSSMTKEQRKAFKRTQRKTAKKEGKKTIGGIAHKVATYGGAWTISVTDTGKIGLDLTANRFMMTADQERSFKKQSDFKKLVKESESHEVWSDYRVEGPSYVSGQWNHVVFSVDRQAKKVNFFVNGKKYESKDKLDFSVPLMHVAKKYVTFNGHEERQNSFDEMRYFNYAISDSMSRAMYKHRSPDFTALPLAGDKRPPNNATLVWKSVSPKSKRVLEYADNAEFKGKKTVNVSGKEEYTLTKLENKKTYYWRVISHVGSDKVMSTPSYFSTDDTVEIKAPVIVEKIVKKPPVFLVGKPVQDFQLAKYVNDSPGDKHTYQAVLLPKWATLTSAGIIFTAHGPKEEHLGDNKIVVKVTDQTGQSTEKEFSLKVVNEIVAKKKKKKKK